MREASEGWQKARGKKAIVFNWLLNLENGVKLMNYVLRRLLDSVEICWKVLLWLVVV